MSNYEVLHDILVKLFQEILDIESKALITSEFKDISVNDMHIIEAIGERTQEYVFCGKDHVGYSGNSYHCY